MSGSGEPTYLFTNSAHSWNHAYVTVQDRAHFVFAVKACSSVRLLLGENFVSHDVILSLNAGDSLQVSSANGGLFSEPTGAQTSFAGFSLHDTMRPVLAPAFSVSRIDGQSASGVISYNFDITNRNLAVNLQTGVFTPQKDGIYFLSFSVGVLSSANNIGVNVQLTVDGEPKAELTRQHNSYDGIDTLSRCVLNNVE